MSKRWYVIHTYSGYENKVKTDLEHRIETYGLESQVVDIKIPTEEVTEVKEGGKSEIKEAKVFPGYVLVRMEVDDNTWVSSARTYAGTKSICIVPHASDSTCAVADGTIPFCIPADMDGMNLVGVVASVATAGTTGMSTKGLI